MAPTLHSRVGIVDGADWLDAWEAAQLLPPGLREAAVLAPACGCSADALATLPLGVRDRLLLDLHGALFGAALACTAVCPACGERCEWTCDAPSLRLPDTPGAADGVPRSWSHGDWSLQWRPADGRDLAAAAAQPDEDGARRQLLSRVIGAVRRDGREESPGALPADVVEALEQAMAAADPQTDLRIGIVCPACAHGWEAPLDLGGYVWTEFDAWARRTLLEVHHLAARYGWTEPEVLALPPSRRARYLALGEV